MDADDARELLRGVREPEIGADIVSLGLVREVLADPARILVRLTMVSRQAPQAVIVDAVERALWRPGGPAVDVEVVWQPRWSAGDVAPEAMGSLARPVFRDEVRNAPPRPVSPEAAP